MHPRHVDLLARLLATPASRRRLLARVAALPMLGALLGTVPPEDAASKGRRKRRKKRHKHGDNRRRNPRQKTRCQGHLARCGKACVDPGADAAHCGACHQRCAAGETCQQGACTCQAAACAGCCDAGACQEGTSDQQCGRAGVACTACGGGRVCQDGACVCPAGEEICGGQCVDPQTDDAHCGACGTACDAGTACVDGACRCTAASCPVGCCDAGEVCRDGRSMTDCGSAGTTCAPCTGGDVCRDDDLGGVCLANQPPEVTDASFTFDEGITCGLVTLSGTDPEGDALSFQLISAPINARLFLYDDEAGDLLGPELTTSSPAEPAEAGTDALRLCYKPNSRFFFGLDSFRYIVKDSYGAESPERLIQITVLDIN